MDAIAGHRFFAAIYDRMLAGTEKAGLREMRSRLLRTARGRTLELGAGTGLNLPHYPDSVTELVMTEPDPHMAKRLRRKLESEPRSFPVEVIEAGAERLPFEDASFDTVTATLVLCTVPDPEAAAAEVARVLRPGGAFLYLEHVRDAEGSRRARWQDRLERPWGVLAAGCHPNRNTAELIGEMLQIEEAEDADMPGSGTALVRPVIQGLARRPA
jgi:ubiquinone/menaquinone biosynthesis C-methylase UbiE